MNRVRRTFTHLGCICSLACALWCPPTPAAHCSTPIRVIVSTSEQPSPSLRLLNKVLRELHCESVLVEYDARQNRRLRMLAEDKVDVVPEASDLPERRVYAWVSTPYRIEHTGIFVLQSEHARWPALSLQHIREARIKVLVPSGWHGASFEQWRHTMKSAPNYFEFSSSAEAMRDLQKRRADALIATDYTINIELKKPSQLQRSGEWIYSEPVSFLLSKKTFSPALRDEFNHILKRILEHPNTDS